MSYHVKLQVFEGPLDLLLFLIKKEEIDIYSIPIARITQQYLEYIELMQMLDLEIAGEFILMAATLMKIKVKMMLPYEGEDEEEIEDLKDQLIRSLVEYRRFKEVAEKLSDVEYEERKKITRTFSYEQDLKSDDYSVPSECTIFDLITILKNVLDRTPEKDYYNVKKEAIHIEEQIKFILNLVKSNGKISFLEIVSPPKDKIFAIVTFLAILELSKRKIVRLFQVHPFKDILISRWN